MITIPQKKTSTKAFAAPGQNTSGPKDIPRNPLDQIGSDTTHALKDNPIVKPQCFAPDTPINAGTNFTKGKGKR